MRVRNDTYLGSARGMCRECREIVDARYAVNGEGVDLVRRCPEHGEDRGRVAASATWFLDAIRQPAIHTPPVITTNERVNGCPHDCGPCPWHEQRCHLPVFSITNACDLRCPICFTYNRADETWFMSEDEFRANLALLKETAGSVDLINITGGEPTMHPDLVKLVEIAAAEPFIGRVTVNSNGLRLAREPELARQLGEAGAYVILSFDTFDPETSIRIHNRDIVKEKLAALDNLAQHNMQTTILTVSIPDINDNELGRIWEMVLERDHIRSWTIQTMTYTGQGGGNFLPRKRHGVEDIEILLEKVTDGQLLVSDFAPHPAAHPLCYGVTYVLSANGKGTVPMNRIFNQEILTEMLSGGYLMRPGEDMEDAFTDAVNQVYAGDRGDISALPVLRSLVQSLYPKSERLNTHERQRRAEKMIKTIYVHAHMDEETLDLTRLQRCPDLVPTQDGKLIPACAYNLFYRMNDERFWVDEN